MTEALREAVEAASDMGVREQWSPDEWRAALLGIFVARPDQPPVCPDHREAQHRDNKPPWCDSCGWRHGEPAQRYGNGRVVA